MFRGFSDGHVAVQDWSVLVLPTPCACELRPWAAPWCRSCKGGRRQIRHSRLAGWRTCEGLFHVTVSGLYLDLGRRRAGLMTMTCRKVRGRRQREQAALPRIVRRIDWLEAQEAGDAPLYPSQLTRPDKAQIQFSMRHRRMSVSQIRRNEGLKRREVGSLTASRMTYRSSAGGCEVARGTATCPTLQAAQRALTNSAPGVPKMAILGPSSSVPS